MAKAHGIGDTQKKIERMRKKHLVLLVLIVSLLLSVLAALIVLISTRVLLLSWPIFTLVLALSSLILLLLVSIIYDKERIKQITDPGDAVREH